MSPSATQAIKCENENDDDGGGVSIPITIVRSQKLQNSDAAEGNAVLDGFKESKAKFCPDTIPITAKKLLLIENTFLKPSPELLHEMMMDSIGFCGNGAIECNADQVLDDKRRRKEGFFWMKFENEIHLLQHQQQNASSHLLVPLKEKDITHLSATIKEIPLLLKNLYPNCSILQNDLLPLYDPSFIISQILNPSSLDKWLFQELFANIVIVLKTNCAPKRDIEIDHLVLQARCNDWVGVFQSILDLVKAMKMDLINFKVNKSKILLIKEGKKDLICYWMKKRMNEPLEHFDWLMEDSTKMHNYIAQILIAIVIPTPTPPNKKTINTFIPDARRLSQFRDAIQDVLVLNVILLIFQIMIPSVNKEVGKFTLQEVKKRIHLTLQKENSSLFDISSQMQLVINRYNGKHMKTEEISLLKGMINNWIDPQHRIYRLSLQNLTKIFKESLCGSTRIRKGKTSFLTLQKGTIFNLVAPEITLLVRKLKSYWSLHWSIHSHTSYKKNDNNNKYN